MNVIHKYPLGACVSPLLLPAGYVILSVGLDPAGDVCVWARVNPAHPKEAVEFRIIGTGQPVDARLAFLGTVLQGPWVWHIFK